MTTTADTRPDAASGGVIPTPRHAPRGEGSPTALYEAALRSDGRLWARHPDGRRELLPVSAWRGCLVTGDASLLRRCAGPTLDVGCGPGRITAALAARGVPALGIDVAPLAVRLARRAGGSALCRDVFGPLPAEGRWSTLVLADGNIGIGGDPGRLLTRAAELVSPGGRVLVEVQAQAQSPSPAPSPSPSPSPARSPSRPRPSGTLFVRLERPDGRLSRSFPWAFVGPGEIFRHASTAGLAVAGTWHDAGRGFAMLHRP